MSLRKQNQNRTWGDRSFATAAAPHLWNELPFNRAAKNITVYKKKKTNKKKTKKKKTTIMSETFCNI